MFNCNKKRYILFSVILFVIGLSIAVIIFLKSSEEINRLKDLYNQTSDFQYKIQIESLKIFQTRYGYIILFSYVLLDAILQQLLFKKNNFTNKKNKVIFWIYYGLIPFLLIIFILFIKTQDNRSFLFISNSSFLFLYVILRPYIKKKFNFN